MGVQCRNAIQRCCAAEEYNGSAFRWDYAFTIEELLGGESEFDELNRYLKVSIFS